MIGFFGAKLGVIYGDVTGPEAWIIGILTVLTTGLMFAVSLQPARATGAVTGILTIYLVLHLNVGSILAHRTSPGIVYIIPDNTWFFLLVLFHHLTNLGFSRRAIVLLVNLGPVPLAAYVLSHPLAVEDIDAVVTFLFSFIGFVVFVGFYTRQWDEEVRRAAIRRCGPCVRALLYDKGVRQWLRPWSVYGLGFCAAVEWPLSYHFETR